MSFFFARKVILDNLQQLFIEVTDNQLQQVITSLALSIDRVKFGYHLELLQEKNALSSEVYQLAQQILGEITKESRVVLPEEECIFFARQFEGVNYKKPQNIFLENFDVELSYQVRELIRLVSKQTEIDFRVDDTLYYDLLTHLSAAFKRMDNLVQFSNNPLLEKVMEEYRSLAIAIRENLSQLFPEMHFSQDELAYIVIHFAASLERNPSKKDISTLLMIFHV